MPKALYPVGCPPSASVRSSSSEAKAGSLPKDKGTPPSSRSRRLRSSTPSKSPRRSSTQPRADPDGEFFFDLQLEKKGELEAVHAFARCLTGVDDMSKEVFYDITRTSGGFQASLRIPAWSSESYEGEVMPNEKRAKKSAAYNFKTDPTVLERSRRFPKGVKRLTNLATVDGFRQKRRLAQETRNQHVQT
ncbi:unnamed protein product [Symbiodinium sp. CCMP2592]|nr:unnamed protein product [Symbiodinium sp. CCMP2592]